MLSMFIDSIVITIVLHLTAYCGASVIVMAKPNAALAILIMYTSAIAAWMCLFLHKYM